MTSNEELQPMTAIDQADVNRIHERLDSLFKITNENAINIAKLALAAEFDRDKHLRPCHHHVELKKEVNKHFEAEEKDRSVWKSAWVKSAVHLVELGVVFVFGWMINK